MEGKFKKLQREIIDEEEFEIFHLSIFNDSEQNWRNSILTILKIKQFVKHVICECISLVSNYSLTYIICKFFAAVCHLTV